MNMFEYELVYNDKHQGKNIEKSIDEMCDKDYWGEVFYYGSSEITISYYYQKNNRGELLLDNNEEYLYVYDLVIEAEMIDHSDGNKYIYMDITFQPGGNNPDIGYDGIFPDIKSAMGFIKDSAVDAFNEVDHAFLYRIVPDVTRLA